MAKDTPDDEPRLPGDLPPLPSKHYKPRPPTHQCPDCGKRYRTPEELTEHARRAHRTSVGDSP
jgi:hypothetical protein